MVRKILYTAILLLGLTGPLVGQFKPLLDQYHFNGLAINPAYAGRQEALHVGIHSRIQWVGFEGAPRTNTLSVHTPLRNKKVNLGLLLLSDRLGSQTESGFLINYAYRIELKRGKLSLGLAAGLTNLTVNMNSIRYTDPNDLVLHDPSRRALMPEFSIGSFYYTDRFHLGISIPLLLSHPFEGGGRKPDLEFSLSKANYMITTGYQFQLSESMDLLPSVLFRSVPANNTQLDIACNLIYRELLWIGASVRTNGNLTTHVQVRINPQLRLGYSYGYELSELSSYQHGSHEIAIQYTFRYVVEAVSPRF
jgi:type IX secretion system PorP/SprF family membrane protein